MGKIVFLNNKKVQERELERLNNLTQMREFFTNYGRWLERNKLEDNLNNYEQFLSI